MEDRILEIGRRVAMIRKHKRITQKKLAEMTGLHRNYIHYIEKGRRNYQVKTLVSLAEALDVPLETLFERAPLMLKQRGVDQKGINELTISGRWVSDVIPFLANERNMKWQFRILVSGSNLLEDDHIIIVALNNNLKELLKSNAYKGDYLKIYGRMVSNTHEIDANEALDPIQNYVVAENIILI